MLPRQNSGSDTPLHARTLKKKKKTKKRHAEFLEKGQEKKGGENHIAKYFVMIILPCGKAGAP